MNQAQKELFRAYVQAATAELNAGAVGPCEALLATYGLRYDGEHVQLEGYPLKASFSRENLAELAKRNCAVRAGYREFCEVLAAIDEGGNAGTEFTKSLSETMRAERRLKEISHEVQALQALEFRAEPVPRTPSNAAEVKRRYQEARTAVAVAEEALEHARPLRRKKAASRLEQERKALKSAEERFNEIQEREREEARAKAQNAGIEVAQAQVQDKIAALFEERKRLEKMLERRGQSEQKQPRKEEKKQARRIPPKATQKRSAQGELEPEL